MSKSGQKSKRSATAKHRKCGVGGVDKYLSTEMPGVHKKLHHKLHQTKNVLIIGGVLAAVGAGGYGVYALVKWIGKLKTDQSQKEHQKDIVDSELSYDKATYTDLANRLFTELDSIDINEDSVYNMLGQLKNKSDWNQLHVSFGSKASKSWYDSTKGDLSLWLQEKMSSDTEQQRIASILNAIEVTW